MPRTFAWILPLLCTALFANAAKAADFLDRTGTQWAPFLEWTVTNPDHAGNPFDIIATATFTHVKSGERRVTGMFFDGRDRWKFRFTGTRPGKWGFVTSSRAKKLNGLKGTVTIKPNPRGYGFVIGVKSKWARQQGVEGKPEAFVPQFVMYGHPGTFHRKPKKIDADIELGKLAAKNQTWKAPYKSDWAIAVGDFTKRKKK